MREPLTVTRPNRVALLARDPEAIARNAEMVRRLARSYPDDGTDSALAPVRRRRKRPR